MTVSHLDFLKYRLFLTPLFLKKNNLDTTDFFLLFMDQILKSFCHKEKHNIVKIILDNPTNCPLISKTWDLGF